MWRVLISLITALGAAVAARVYRNDPTRVAITTGSAVRSGEATTAVDAAPERDTDTAPRPGWSRPKPEIIPRSTYWPILFAGGLAFMLWGTISDIWTFGAGLILFVISMIGWVNDLLNE